MVEQAAVKWQHYLGIDNEKTLNSGNPSSKDMAILSQAGKPEGAETIMGPSRTDDGIVQITNSSNTGNESYSNM